MLDDTLKDFAPIMQIGAQPYAITVHPSIGASTVKHLIVMTQKQPGAINYASPGNGGAQHMFAALFVHMAKINRVHIPYKDSGLARANLLGSHVKVGCLGISSVINRHKAGQLRIIGVTSAKRSPELHEARPSPIPGGYDASLWSGLLAPRRTPAAVIQRIPREVAKLLQWTDVQNAFERMGTYVVSTDLKAFREYVESEYANWKGVVRAVNLHIN